MEIFVNSIFVKKVGYMLEVFSDFQKSAGGVYQKSFTHRLMRNSYSLIISALKDSFFGRLTERDSAMLANYFGTSTIVKLSSDLKRRFGAKAQRANIRITSRFCFYVTRLKQDFLSTPLREASLILIAALITNTAFTLIWQRQVNLWGWVIRGLLLFLGISGLFCSSNWHDIKGTAFIFRLMGRAMGKAGHLK